MKKIYLTLIVMLLYMGNTNAQFYSQYFDGADTSITNSVLIDLDTSAQNVWQIGPPQKTIFNAAATLPNVIVTDTINYYPDTNASRFVAKVWLGMQIFGVFALQWKQKLDFDQGFDGGIIEYSIDTGHTWINVFNNPYVYNFYGFDQANADTLANGEFAFSGTDTSWKDIWLCFDYSWLQQFNWNDTLMIRFSMVSDSANNNKEGWMIDNMLSHATWIHTVKEVEQENYLNVYPNPANDIVTIQTQKMMEYHIIEKMELVDPMGRVIDSWEYVPTKFWFSTQKYKSGVYFLKVRTNLKEETVPLIISKR